MAEIIELLSSSPPRSQEKYVATRTNNKSSLSQDLFRFSSDDFDTIGDLEFMTDQPSKRRKLSRPPIVSESRNCLDSMADNIFDLASETNSLPDVHLLKNDVLLSVTDLGCIDIDNETTFRFSSSAPEPVSKALAKEPFVLELSSDNDFPEIDPIQSSSQPAASSKPVFSERTVNLLAGLRTTNANRFSKAHRNGKSRDRRSLSADLAVNQMGRFKQISKPSAATKDNVIDSSQPHKTTQTSGTGCTQSNEGQCSRTVSKASSKAERAAEKEVEKERKRKEKEQKALEKQKAADIAEVNKSRTNKKNSTPEMIVDMPVSLQNLSVGNQVSEYMAQLSVQVEFTNEEAAKLIGENEVIPGHIIRWRRKVTADYDEDLEIWKPLPQPRVTRENHVIIFLKAEEFVSIAVLGQSTVASIKSASEIPESVMKLNLDSHVQSLRAQYSSNTIIYLIEGLAAWNRKSQTVKNRAYTAAVRSQVLVDGEMTASSAPPLSRGRPKNTTKKQSNISIDLSSITQDLTETLLLHLQLHHQPLLIQHTTSAATTASQITALTQHLSTRPYRLAEQSHNLTSASFCMTVGQIRTGSTPHETYINMLQEVNRVTPSMAYGISNAGYRNIGELARGFRKNGNLMLEDVRKSVNKDGGWSDRRLGPMVSKRLFKVFTGRDPEARDGIA